MAACRQRMIVLNKNLPGPRPSAEVGWFKPRRPPLQLAVSAQGSGLGLDSKNRLGPGRCKSRRLLRRLGGLVSGSLTQLRHNRTEAASIFSSKQLFQVSKRQNSQKPVETPLRWVHGSSREYKQQVCVAKATNLSLFCQRKSSFQ